MRRSPPSRGPRATGRGRRRRCRGSRRTGRRLAFPDTRSPLQHPEEAAAVPGVAHGVALEAGAHEQRAVLAVVADLVEAQPVPGPLALRPKLAARARPE